MKKSITLLFAALVFVGTAFADEAAELTFEKKTHNFGIVAQDTCIVTCKFAFTNTGNAPLIIHQAISSCGCTAPDYSREPVAPGEKGFILVTYNGKAKRPGVFKKSITVHSNASNTPVRIYIEGEMIMEENIEELVPATVPEEQVEEASEAITVTEQPVEKPRKRFRFFSRRKSQKE